MKAAELKKLKITSVLFLSQYTYLDHLWKGKRNKQTNILLNDILK